MARYSGLPCAGVIVEANEEQLIAAVQQALSEGLDEAIVDVQLLGRYERDGDSILRFQVTFEGQPKDWNSKLVASAVQLVRPRLAEIGELGFPLFTFVTVVDAKQRARA